MMAEKGMEEEFLTCSICYDVYKDPKTLSCLHRFCEKCLHDYIICQKKSSLLKLGGFPCPVCRDIIRAPGVNRDPTEWAHLLKTDFHLTSLIRFVEQKRDKSLKAAALNHGQDRPKHACSVHKDKEVDLFCVDCQTVICHLCAGVSHRSCNEVSTLKEIASNKIEIAQNSVKKNGKTIEEILKNREKAFDRFDRLKSEVESQIKNWSHDWQKAINNEERRLLCQLENQCKKVYDRITPKLLEFDSKVSSFKQNVDILVNDSQALSDYDVVKLISVGTSDLDIADFSAQKNMVSTLEKVKLQFKKSHMPDFTLGTLQLDGAIEKPCKAQHQQMPQKRLEVTSSSGTHVYALAGTETVLFSNDYSQQDNPFQDLQSSGAAAGSLTQSLRAKISKIFPSSLSMDSGQSNQAAKEKTTKLPPRKVTQSGSHSSSDIPGMSSEDTNMGANSVSGAEFIPHPKRPELSSNVQKIRTISTKFREDALEPKLRDIIVIGPGRTVVVTDWANQSVKAFFLRRDKDCRLGVGGKPWCITQLSETQAAVSLPLSKQIAIVKITSPLTTQNCFVVAKNYSGLATLNSKMLVASGGSDPPSVDIINLFGEVLSSFSTSPDNVPLFKYPAYVSVTSAMHILVADKKLGAIFCLTHKGELKFKFQPKSPKNLQEPCGLCSTPSGHVLVVETRGLLQLTPKGQLDRPLIRKCDGYVSEPKGVALDSDGLIYVTTEEQEVSVFSID